LVFKNSETKNRTGSFEVFEISRPKYVILALLMVFLLDNFFLFGAAAQRGTRPPHSRGFLDHTQ
jgi:hypothetical protein